MKTFTIKTLEWRQEESKPWLLHCGNSFGWGFTINSHNAFELTDWTSYAKKTFATIEEAKDRAQSIHNDKLLRFLNETETPDVVQVATLAGKSREWFERSAAIEGDSEIGAGTLTTNIP